MAGNFVVTFACSDTDSFPWKITIMYIFIILLYEVVNRVLSVAISYLRLCACQCMAISYVWLYHMLVDVWQYHTYGCVLVDVDIKMETSAIVMPVLAGIQPI